MAQNFKEEGCVLQYTNATGTAIATGDVVIIGALAGVALVNIADTATGSVRIDGVFEVAKTTGTAYSQGDELFWNVGTAKATKTATDKPLGVAFEAALSGDTTCLVKLAGGGNAVATAATVAALVDNSGGAAADGTIAAITLTEPANLAAQTVINGQLAAAVKELATTLNAVIASLKAAGLMA